MISFGKSHVLPQVSDVGKQPIRSFEQIWSVRCDPKYLIDVEASLRGVAAKVSLPKLDHNNGRLAPKVLQVPDRLTSQAK